MQMEGGERRKERVGVERREGGKETKEGRLGEELPDLRWYTPHARLQ